MGKAQRPKIKFDSLNERLLYIVSADSEACLEMIRSFQELKFEVQFFQNFNDLYAGLESGRLGYVLLSRDLQEAFGDAHLAGFIQRRFNVPILSFSTAAPTEGEEEKFTRATPEIIHLRSGLNPVDIVREITGFRTEYERVPVTTPTAPPTKYDELIKGLRGIVAEDPLHLPARQEMKVLALRVKSGEDRYILLCGVPLPATNLEKEEALKASLKNFLQSRFPESEVSQSQIFDAITIEEYRRLSSGSHDHWQGHIGPVDCVLALIAESAELKQADEHPQGRAIPLEEWLTEDRLAFPVFHWLERNQKMIRYAKAGRRVDSKSFDRFTRRGIAYLLIQESDLDRYEILRQLINSRAA